MGVKVLADAAASDEAVRLGQSATFRGLPSYAGVTPRGSFDAARGLYNANAPNMRAALSGLMRALGGGTGKFRGLVIGDSTGLGYNGTTVVNKNSYARRLADTLAAQLGVPRAGGFDPATMATSILSDRFVTTGTVNINTYAGLLQLNSAATVTYTAEVEGTGLDVYLSNLSATNIAVTIDGVSQTAITTTGADTYKKQSYTGLAYGLHTMVITAPANWVFLCGIAVTHTTGIEVHNLSFGGSKAASGTSQENWTNTVGSQLYANRRLGWDAAAITPDFLVICLGANDMAGSDTVANATAGITTIRNWYPTASVTLLDTVEVSGVNATLWDDYCAAKYALADTLDCSLLDLRHQWGSRATAATAGLLGTDSQHPSSATNQQIGRMIGTVLASKTSGLTELDPETSGLVDRARGGAEATQAAEGTSGTVTLRLGGASIFTLTPTGNVTALNIVGVPASGTAASVTLRVTQGATPYTIATPTGGSFFGAATPTQVASKRCRFDYFTLDAGATWDCSGTVQV